MFLKLNTQLPHKEFLIPRTRSSAGRVPAPRRTLVATDMRDKENLRDS